MSANGMIVGKLVKSLQLSQLSKTTVTDNLSSRICCTTSLLVVFEGDLEFIFMSAVTCSG